jgi:hypothetical protein
VIDYLDRPTHREALAALEAALDRGALTTLFGRCTVEYDGRASSTLGPGDRLVVLKPDGTALVHTDADRTPVNWQPPGTTRAASVREDRLRVVVERSSPDERLLVSFGTVAHLAAMDASDPHDIELRGRKADLRDRVLDESGLVAPGFAPVETERRTVVGAMDLFGRDADGRPVVVELKRRRVGPAAVDQLARYVDAVEREPADGEGADAVVDGEDDAGAAGAAAEVDADDADAGDADGDAPDRKRARGREADRPRPSTPTVCGVLVAPSVTDGARELLDERGLAHVAVEPRGED